LRTLHLQLLPRAQILPICVLCVFISNALYSHCSSPSACENFKMNFLITHDEAVALVANPPTLAPRPNFTNLRALRLHLQRALHRIVNPQNNVLGWSGLVMSRPMYQMLSTSPFRLLSDPRPQAICYRGRVPILDVNGDPELDATGNPTYVPVPALDRATQATIDADFILRLNYWLLYLNIKRA